MVKYIFQGNDYGGSSSVSPNDNNLYFYNGVYVSGSEITNGFLVTRNALTSFTTRYFFNSVPYVSGIAYYERDTITSYNTLYDKSLSNVNNNLVRSMPILPYSLLLYTSILSFNSSEANLHEWKRPIFRGNYEFKDIAQYSWNGLRASSHCYALRNYGTSSSQTLASVRLYTIKYATYNVEWLLHAIYSPLILYPNYHLIIPNGHKITIEGYMSGQHMSDSNDLSYVAMSLNGSKLTFNSWTQSNSTPIFNGQGWIRSNYSGNAKVVKFGIKLNSNDEFVIERGIGLLHKVVMDVPS